MCYNLLCACMATIAEGGTRFVLPTNNQLRWLKYFVATSLIAVHWQFLNYNTRNDNRKETLWIIGVGNKGNSTSVLWSKEMDRGDAPPQPSKLFPELINKKLIDWDPMSQLHGQFREMRRENEKMSVNLQKTSDRLRDITNKTKMEKHRMNTEIHDLKLERERH